MTPVRVLMSDIIAETAHVFGVTVEDLKGTDRTVKYVYPRHVCGYLGKRLTSLSYPQIGRALGGRDHSTIIHAYHRTEERAARDPEFAAYVDAVRIRVLTTRERAEQRRREAAAIKQEKMRQQMAQLEQFAREEAQRQAVATPMDDMEEISAAVAAYRAKGGSFVEVRA